MGKKRKRPEPGREAWDRHVDDTIRNLRELAAGRAERDWRAKREQANS
jgi:hypothetical protein